MIRSTKTVLLASAASFSLLAAATGIYAQQGQTLPSDTTSVGALSSSLAVDLRTEISRLDTEIADARGIASQFEGGVLGIMSDLNTQTLSLTRSLLESRLVAEEGGTPVQIIVPVTQPDPALAAEIEQEMVRQQEIIDTAQAEVNAAGGLMAMVAMTSLQTEKVTMAQLRQAMLRARYGIAYPDMGAQPQSVSAESRSVTQPSDTTNQNNTDQENAVDRTKYAWSDPDHPEIDYSKQIFSTLDSQDFEISGWWGIQYSRADIDDSPQIFAINVSDYGGIYQTDNPSLIVACFEQEPRVVFNTDSFILTEIRSNNIPVTMRIDSDEAVQINWSKLTDNSGAGLFGKAAEDMIRDLRDAKKVFLRLAERNGETHSITIDLAGSTKVFEEVAQTCKFSLIELTSNDYKAIQTMLNAGGFDVGAPDGIWGRGSRRALMAYQAQSGLEETGVPDQATLRTMGM